MLTGRIGRVLRYFQKVESDHARDNDETTNGKDTYETNLLPPGYLYVVEHSHGWDVDDCILEDVQRSVCKEERIDVDASSRNREPGFMYGSALEHAGQHRRSSTNDDEGHASPHELSECLLYGETEVEVEDRYLCHCYAGVIYYFAKVVQLSLESAFGVSRQWFFWYDSPQAKH